MTYGEVRQHHICSHSPKKLITGCSDGATKCPYVKDQERLSFVSSAVRIETAAPNSCCYTLWCSVEMWAVLLIGLLLASSLMSHCSFHDPLLKEVGVWCNPTGFVSGPEPYWFSDLSLETEQTLWQMYFISLTRTNKPGFIISFLIDELPPCIQHNLTSLSHPSEDMDVLLNLA